MDARSRSRGREQVFSSGRGGAGNIRPISQEPSQRTKGPDDFSPSRGREVPVIGDTLTHSGRGGAGNVRSPSRDADGNRKAAKEVDEYARAHRDPNAPVTTGRGGYGNVVNRSRSRSKDPATTGNSTAPPVHTYGHGGAGNVAYGSGAHGEGHLKSVEEDEARAYQKSGEGLVHSSGRGGAGNISSAAVPSRKSEAQEMHDHHHHAEGVASTGRGGAGNFKAAEEV